MLLVLKVVQNRFIKQGVVKMKSDQVKVKYLLHLFAKIIWLKQSQEQPRVAPQIYSQPLFLASLNMDSYYFISHKLLPKVLFIERITGQPQF